MIRALIKDGALYSIPLWISRGLSIILVPLYTRVLSPADYGSLDLLNTFAALVNLTIALEVSQAVARFYAAEPDSTRKIAYASSAMWFTVMVYTVFAAGMLTAPDLSAQIMGRTGLKTAFRIGICSIWVYGVFYLVQNQFRWELRSRDFALVSVTMTAVTAVMSAWLTLGLGWGLTGVVMGSLLGNSAGAAIGLYKLRLTFRPVVALDQLKEMLAFSTPLVVSGIAVWINTYIDRLVIRHYLTIDDVGLYGVGFRIASVAGIVMAGFHAALTPLIYAHYQKPDTPGQIARIFRLFVVVALTLFLVLTLFATDIIRLMTTSAYMGGSVMAVYLVPVVLLANGAVFSPGIYIAKKTWLLVIVNACCAVLNLTLSLLLVPLLGIQGAGLATLASYCLIFVWIIGAGQRHYRVPHRFTPLLVATAIAALLAVNVPRLSPSDAMRWPASVAALGLFCVSALLLELVTPTEVRTAWDAVRRRVKSLS